MAGVTSVNSRPPDVPRVYSDGQHYDDYRETAIISTQRDEPPAEQEAAAEMSSLGTIPWLLLAKAVLLVLSMYIVFVGGGASLWRYVRKIKAQKLYDEQPGAVRAYIDDNIRREWDLLGYDQRIRFYMQEFGIFNPVKIVEHVTPRRLEEAYESENRIPDVFRYRQITTESIRKAVLDTPRWLAHRMSQPENIDNEAVEKQFAAAIGRSWRYQEEDKRHLFSYLRLLAIHDFRHLSESGIILLIDVNTDLPDGRLLQKLIKQIEEESLLTRVHRDYHRVLARVFFQLEDEMPEIAGEGFDVRNSYAIHLVQTWKELVAALAKAGERDLRVPPDAFFEFMRPLIVRMDERRFELILEQSQINARMVEMIKDWDTLSQARREYGMGEAIGEGTSELNILFEIPKRFVKGWNGKHPVSGNSNMGGAQNGGGAGSQRATGDNRSASAAPSLPHGWAGSLPGIGAQVFASARGPSLAAHLDRLPSAAYNIAAPHVLQNFRPIAPWTAVAARAPLGAIGVFRPSVTPMAMTARAAVAAMPAAV